MAEPTPEAALRYVEESMAEGCVYAHSLMGQLLIAGRPPIARLDQETGARLVLQAAESGHPASMGMAGWVYRHGVGVARDLTEAERWMRRAAAQGATDQLYQLGQAYLTGKGVGLEPVKGCELLYEAARHGSRVAHARLQQLAAEGLPAAKTYPQLWRLDGQRIGAEFSSKSLREAVIWLEQHAPANRRAIIAIADLRLEQHSTLHDPPRAIAALESLSAREDDEARFLLAEAPLLGRGVKREPADAVPIIVELAGRGVPAAQARLGWMYYWGSHRDFGLPKDPVQARQWSRRAAEAGDLFGQLNAGACYQHGIGGEQSYTLAHWFYGLAASRGSREGRWRESRLVGHLDD